MEKKEEETLPVVKDDAGTQISVLEAKKQAKLDKKLVHAANHGWQSPFKARLEEGADINARNKNDGRTALMYWALQGNNAAVKFSLEAGADLGLQDNNGITALMYTAGWSRPVATHILIKAGADPSLIDENGKTALDYAEEAGNFGCIRCLEKATQQQNQKPEQEEKTGWSSNNKDLVTYVTFDESTGGGMSHMFNFSSGIVLVSMLDRNLKPVGTTTMASFADFDKDADCFDPAILITARQKLGKKPKL